MSESHPRQGVTGRPREPEGKDSSADCPFCGITYSSSSGVAYHMRQEHPEEMLECGECGRLCRDKRGLEVHKSNKHREEQPSFDCKNCGGKKYERPSYVDRMSFCSPECCHEYWRENNPPNFKDGSINYYGRNWREQRRKARIRDQSRCQDCGKTPVDSGKNISVHHIRPLRQFVKEYDRPECFERGNELANLVCLCDKCHRKWEGIPLRPDTR